MLEKPSNSWGNQEVEFCSFDALQKGTDFVFLPLKIRLLAFEHFAMLSSLVFICVKFSSKFSGLTRYMLVSFVYWTHFAHVYVSGRRRRCWRVSVRVCLCGTNSLLSSKRRKRCIRRKCTSANHIQTTTTGRKEDVNWKFQTIQPIINARSSTPIY